MKLGYAVKRMIKASIWSAFLQLKNIFSRTPVTGNTAALVSLTSHSHRISICHIAIESIAHGRALPSRIILWLPENASGLPFSASLRRLMRRGLEIKYVADLGPHTKYFYALGEVSSGLRLVTADDDIIYPSHWLSRILATCALSPDVLWCYRAHNICRSPAGLLPYASWPLANEKEPSRQLFATGVGGIAYPDELIRLLRLQGENFVKDCLPADDIWINYIALNAGISIGIVGGISVRQIPVPTSQKTALANSNVAGGRNDRILSGRFAHIGLHHAENFDIQPKAMFIIYTWACNSKCITCDYWKSSHKHEIKNNLILDSIAEYYPQSLRVIYFTGGEVLLRSEELFELAEQIRFRFPGLPLYLATNGLLLKKFAHEISQLFDRVIVSMDAANVELYKQIRGVDAFDLVLAGIRLFKERYPNISIRLRTLVLPENVDSLSDIVALGVSLKVDRMSFLAENTSSRDVFGRDDFNMQISASARDVRHSGFNIAQRLAVQIDKVKCTPLLVEELSDLQRVLAIYKGQLTAVKCNAGLRSVVLDHDGSVLPCFFIKTNSLTLSENSLASIFCSNEYQGLVTSILQGTRNQCTDCICPRFDID